MTLAVACGALALACGDGDSGTDPGPDPLQATLTAPSFTASQADSTKTGELALRNNEPVAALQVDVVTSPGVATAVVAIATVGRGTGLHSTAVQAVTPGRSRLLLFDPDGDGTIPAGEGSVLSLTFRLTRPPPPGTHPVTLEAPVVVGTDERTFETSVQAGQVTVQP